VSYFAKGDIHGLATVLAEGDFDRLRCSRRAEILKDNDWDNVARRHHDILVRHARGRSAVDALAPAP